MKSMLLVIAALAMSVAFADAAGKGEAVRKLNQEEAKKFVALTVQRSARFEELAVFSRVGNEKRAELKQMLGLLEGEHGLDPKKDYSFDTKSNQLFELVPAKKEGEEPTKKLVTKYKDAEAAAPLAKAMIARKLVENQLAVLNQLAGEKSKEAEIVDKKIRADFKLEPAGIYSFNADDSTIYKTGEKKPVETKAEGEKAPAAKK